MHMRDGKRKTVGIWGRNVVGTSIGVEHLKDLTPPGLVQKLKMDIPFSKQRGSCNLRERIESQLIQEKDDVTIETLGLGASGIEDIKSKLLKEKTLQISATDTYAKHQS